VSVDSALWYSTTILEVAVIAVVLGKNIVRLLPVFFSYLIWTVVSDIVMMTLKSNPHEFYQVFRYEMPIDSVLQFGVLVELAWSVLRPMRSVLSRRTILVISILVLLAGAVVWPLTGFTVIHTMPPDWTRLLRLQQTFSVLRILFFFGLAGLSQFLAIGWRDRELQVATGLGFYSVISMGAALLHTHPAPPAQFHRIDDIVAFSYLCSLLYWAVSFVQKEAQRQEFSPRMQNLLLTVAGAARANRLAIEEIRKNPRH
jgi:hypothetical protein